MVLIFPVLSGHGLVEHQGAWESGLEIYGGDFPYHRRPYDTRDLHDKDFQNQKWEWKEKMRAVHLCTRTGQVFKN